MKKFTVSSAVLSVAISAAFPTHAMDFSFNAQARQGYGETQALDGSHFLDGTQVQVQFPTVIVNHGSPPAYNAATSTYTVPRAGTYIFTTNDSVRVDDGDCLIQVRFLVNIRGGQYVENVDMAYIPPFNGMDAEMSLAAQPGGTMIKDFPSGAQVSVALFVWPGCRGHIRVGSGAHFYGGKL